MWKCFQGKPIEFTGKYQWTDYHARTMLHFEWTHKPLSFPLGYGFDVAPKLVHTYANIPPEYPVTHPSLPSHLDLVLKGPGLPKKGKEVKLHWTTEPCLSNNQVFCNGFMNVVNFEVTVHPKHYKFEFISGHSEQSFGKPEGQVFWRICFSGPFQQVLRTQKSFVPDWKVLNTSFLPRFVIHKIANTPDHLNINLISEATITEFEELAGKINLGEVPDYAQNDVAETLELLKRIHKLLQESNELLDKHNLVEAIKTRQSYKSDALHKIREIEILKNKLVNHLLRFDQGWVDPVIVS